MQNEIWMLILKSKQSKDLMFEDKNNINIGSQNKSNYDQFSKVCQYSTHEHHG